MTANKDWRYEKPRYKVRSDLHPPAFGRVRFDTPWTDTSDDSCYQYATRLIKAGEIIETTFWPHPSAMRPLNESARQTLAFFQSAMRSRMAVMPWQGGRVVLDDGMGGSLPQVVQIRKPTEPPASIQEV